MFEFGPELAPLRRYLERNHADPDGFQSARQVAFFVSKLARIKVKFPEDRSESMFPTLLKIQSELLKKHGWLAKPSEKERKEQKHRRRPVKGLSHRQRVAAAKAPAWVRAAGASKFDPAAEKAFRDSRLGTFGPASEVKRIAPADYLAAKERGET